MKTDFDVLMSIYAAERPSNFDDCMNSIRAQTLQPARLILVIDGPVGAGIDESIHSWQSVLGTLMEVVRLRSNVGLAHALNAGIEHCRGTWVARMDTDDICYRDRFSVQMAFLESHPDIDVVGSWAEQFAAGTLRSLGARVCPASNTEIRRRIAFRNPMNHMTVIFRRQAVLDVGGYTPLLYAEDYLLWMKLAHAGYRMANIQRSLVRARVGVNTLERRRGLRYAALEVKLQSHLLRRRLTTPLRAMGVLVARMSTRLLPPSVLGIVYRFLRVREGAE